MNCKQGDLAIIIKSRAGNEGKIVRCVRLHDFIDRDINGWPTGIIGPRWVIDRPVPGLTNDGHPNYMFTVADSCLRPIRPTDGEDEILRLVGKPINNLQPA